MNVHRTVVILAAAIAGVVGTTGASAATINEPPVAGHSIVVFPERDFISAEGYPAGAGATFSVIRNGVTIGTAHQAVGADGIVEINHPGGGCWENTTPDIIPGDKVRLSVGGDSDQTTTANVTATAARRQGNDLIVTGAASDATGAPLPIGLLNQRIITKDLVPIVGRRRLEAPGDGTIAYDAPGSTHWTARYTGLTSSAIDVALAGETRILWLGADPLAGTELTIYEVGAAGGPAPPCTAPAARMAVTSFDRSAINLGNVDRDLIISGVASDATAVSVRLTGASRSTTPVAVTPTPAGSTTQTWSATIPATAIKALGDGPLTASAVYHVGSATLGGTDGRILKDLVRPPAPRATPGAGAYRTTQVVTLTHADPDPTTAIHYTVNGSEPTAASPVFGLPVHVTGSQTIRAVAIDGAGNVSPLRSFRFAIGPEPTISRARVTCVVTATVCRPQVSFVLSTPARVTVVVRTAKGRVLGTFDRVRPAGRNTIGIPLRLGSRTLRAGTYRLSLRGRLHGVTGRRVGATFTIPPTPATPKGGTPDSDEPR